MKAWEQLEDEPLVWYHRFMKYYLSQPSGTRNVRQAMQLWADAENEELHVEDPKAFHALGMVWHRKHKKYEWDKRANAYDDELYRRRMEEEIEAVKDMTNRQANIGRQMQQLAQIKLNDEFMEIKKTGRPLIDMAEARLLLKEGVAIERQARGLPDYLLAVASLSDKELLSRYERLLGEITEIEGTESIRIGDGKEGDDSPAVDQQEDDGISGEILE